jgi:alkylation response protein AidB-like acyl-CoA dehydrogenase
VEFALNDDQLALQRSVREFLDARYPIERIVEIEDGSGWDPAWWREVAELGWMGISVPDSEGGLGLGFLEEMIVLEELGRAVFPGPAFSTVALALPALRRNTELLEPVVQGARAATLAWAGEAVSELEVRAEGGRLHGAAMFVPDLGSCDLVVVAAAGAEGPTVWAVDRDGQGVTWEELPSVDTTRLLGRIALEQAPAQPLADGDEAGALLAVIRDRALAGLAAEAVGVASRALELSVEYAKSREQFGRPIGVYQAVSHALADAFVEVESARSLAYWAGWAVANATGEASTAAAAAKAYAAEAAVDACERAIQIHGGIGFTWEHPLHRYYRRALWIAAFMGWPAEHRERVAAAVLD